MAELVTLTEAARRKNVNRRTIRKWIRDGRLEASLTAGGHYRISTSDLDRMPMTVSELARSSRVSYRTAYRWVKTGKVKATQQTSGVWLIEQPGLLAVPPRSAVRESEEIPDLGAHAR